MGDIADMILDGTLDEETGEYIGDHNLAKYGSESPGFPVSIGREKREAKQQKLSNIEDEARKKKTKCDVCGKKVKEIGLRDHLRDAHQINNEE